MKLSKEIHKYNKYPERVLQFGEGNFLRAFSDWMIDLMNKKAGFGSSVVVVQPLEQGLVDMLNDQDGLYTLYLNGIKDGEAVREKMVVEAISRGINPYRDYEQYKEIASNPELRFVISNTTEAGIVFDEKDRFEDKPQKSFPGKVTALLYERYKEFDGAKEKGLIFIPCELIDKNGENLKKAILQYAALWKLEDAFIRWIEESNTFCNSLVDRIVPGFPKDSIEEITKELGYEDKLVVEGEQFHLWVIEGPDFVAEEFPADKTGLNVLFVKDLAPYRTRKVRILNGAHTSMVPVALLYGLETVREAVEDKLVGKFVRETIFDEIVPTLDLPKEELDYFANAVLDRFKNPFIKHFLTSIALNSHSKFETRVLPSLLMYKDRKGELSKKIVFSLASLIKLYENKANLELKDDQEILEMYERLWAAHDGTEDSIGKIVETVLAQEKIWKMNLNAVAGLKEQVCVYLKKIEQVGMVEAIKEVN
ncbi:tagaturonate reductase [Anaerosolibacter carboniphilus]|uniref:Altronate oxidoreductase n=1 Tax=Anaerosolibacter carboniphilus TaxID=1417629 RepID=A0A841L601_9FIRM|nr:tagaturonate reductase [Anaerosolibacter carboniphilus]MBB6218522.1 tagaturonate reductase [Anaerosolibacter carboniphilus]